MPKFIKGMFLCEQFFQEAARPVLSRHFPKLCYSAGLVGYGSDVLGYDDAVSTDHMWGPRFYLFLPAEKVSEKERIRSVLSRELPVSFHGYSVNFSEPDPNDNGVRHPEFVKEGPVSPLIFFYSWEEYLKEYLGVSNLEKLSGLDWITFSEHRLLALSSGKLFWDGLGLQSQLNQLKAYPEDVRLYLIASQWSLLAEEQAFVKRCSDVGDEAGSILVCGRIAQHLMRLGFLYCGCYAPYSKWFGTAFDKLPLASKIKERIYAALSASDISAREDNLVEAQRLMAELHNQSGLTDFVDVKIEKYFGRDIKVVFADKIAEAAAEKLRGTSFEGYPLIGSLSAVPDFSLLWDDPARRENCKRLYTT